MSLEPDGADPCSVSSLARGDEMAGTAPVVTEWLLIEDRSVWGSDAVADLRGRSTAHADLIGAAQAVGMRVQAVRCDDRVDRPLQVFRASSGDPAVLTRGDFDDAAPELIAHPLAHLSGRARPLYLVCTHGKRDPCCARWGKPAAMALQDEPDVWETSHVGGHRFAGNLVALPHGLYFGRIDREGVAEVVAGLRNGMLSLGHLRGRSAWPRPAQAAEVFARRRCGDASLEGWRLTGHEQVGDDRWRSVLDWGGQPIEVVVERVESPVLAYEGCLEDEAVPRVEFREVP